ncbi:MAG TPA: Ig-like domain-containing protein, partial [Kofleriaceae bacterium]|nr:Ig-like domain-containing protein [Kofleriaceae bacterium]
MAALGCGGNREDVSSPPVAGGEAAQHPADSPARRASAAGDQPVDRTIDTDMSTPVELDLVAGTDAAGSPDAVVSGHSQGAHGSVTLAGNRATYRPTPGYVGDDRFTYTISDAKGNSSTHAVAVKSCPVKPVCKIAITGPS